MSCRIRVQELIWLEDEDKDTDEHLGMGFFSMGGEWNNNDVIQLYYNVYNYSTYFSVYT